MASEACCRTPVAQHDYKEAGSFVEVDGLKTYKTGDVNAKSAIFIIYDIFGFSPQLLQGADILATHGKEPYQVFVPDILEGNYPDHSWLPSDTEDKVAKRTAYMQGQASPAKAISRIPTLLEKMTELSGGKVERWASVGYCWGGKIVSLSSTSSTPFSAAAEVHPGMVDANDAAKITIPLCMLASGGEPAEDVKKFEETLKVPCHVEIFGDQVHGWMAARGDLKNERNKAEYERGYKALLDFFSKYL